MLGKLIRLRLKGMFSRSAGGGKNGKRKGGKGMAILLAVVFLYCAIVFGFLFYQMFGAMAESLYGTPYDWYFFAMVGLFSFALSFFFTAFTAKSELFEAKDNELLLSMPIKPRLILMSRMATLLLMEYLFALLVLIPAGLAWFMTAGVQTAQLVLYIVCSLLFPLLSAAIACLFGWLLALLTSRVRNKTFITMFFSLAFMGCYFYFYMNAQKYITALLENHAAIAEGMRGWGALFCLFGEGIARADFGKAALLCVLSLAVFAGMTLLLGRGFFKTTSVGSHAYKKANGRIEARSANVSSALLRRELKRFTSSAIYMLNCGLGLILTVIAAVALLIKQADIRAVLPMLDTFGVSQQDAPLLIAVALSFLASMDIITAPSVSLEGKTLWILRSMPVSARQILAAKLKLHELLCAIPTLFLSVAAAVTLRTDALGWAALVLIPQLFVLFSGAFGLMMNLLLPKLDWTSEAVAVKQSGSVLVTMLGLMVYTILACVGLFILVISQQLLSLQMYVLVFTAVSAVLCALCLLWLPGRGARRFDRL